MSDTPSPSQSSPSLPASPAPAAASAASAVRYTGAEPPAKRGNGSGWILALALLQFAGGLVMYAVAANDSPDASTSPGAVLISTMGLAVVFFGLWLWGRKSPFPALLTALIVFVTVHLLDAVFDPLSLLRGVIMKIIIIAGLCTALKKAYVVKREKELEAAGP